jgi:hypothetical protein
MGIKLTAKQKMDMQGKGWTDPEELPGLNGPAKAVYHNPKTGQEFKALPVDPYSIVHYRQRGFVLGHAPSELKAKFDATPKVVDPRTVSDRSGIGETDSLVDIILEMKKEIAELKGQLNSPTKLESVQEVNTQLSLL